MAAQQYKHFSHEHPLAVHHTQPGSDVHCSGCRTRAAGSIYACWACNYFLHDQCFRATRSLKHPGHALHPLTLLPYPTHPSASFYCNTCNLTGDAFCYCCSECNFDLHVHCAASAAAAVQNPNGGYGYAPHQGQPTVYPPPFQTSNAFPSPM